MSAICGTCLPGPNCDPGDDLLLYSLDSQIYPAVLNCPVGQDCPGNLINASILSMPCCGVTLTRNITAGMTVAQVLALIDELVAECAARASFCNGGDGPPPPPPPPPPGGGPPPFQLYFNNRQCCTVICSDGSPFVDCINSGLVVAFSQGSADNLAKSLACILAINKRICLSDLDVKELCGGTAVAPIKITASGPIAQYPLADSWSYIAGTLPIGLTFNGGYITGGVATITGTPTQGGTFTFIIQVVTPTGSYQNKAYTLQVLNIDTASPLTGGVVGTAYSKTLAETGGTAPISWQLATGSSLPPGLSLDETTGKISGTPTTAGVYTFTIVCQDSAT